MRRGIWTCLGSLGRALYYWAVLILALYLIMISSRVILHRQGLERERLIYPLVQLPLEKVQGKNRGAGFSPSENPIMWTGFALYALLNFIPLIQLVSSAPIFRNTIGLIFGFNLPMVGFTYLINLEIDFSLGF